MEVLSLLTQDKVVKEIADCLHKAVGTVRIQIKSIKDKLGCGTDHGLVAKAFRENLLEEPKYDTLQKLPH